MSRLDQLYRRLLLTKFFTKGWGKPDNLKRLFDFRKIISNRELCRHLVPTDYPIHIDKDYPDGDLRILEGHFLSPLAKQLPGIMPKEVETATFQMVLPSKWKDPTYKPMCIHLAGTGDHFFWRRRLLMAKPLLKDYGIASLLLENPYYGSRKPKGQLRSSLHNVSDLFVMGGALILESLALLHWCENQGYGPLGLTGVSMGGHMASLAATNWHEPISLIPCLSWTTASIVFTQGVMSGAIPWKTLETQFFENSIYQDEISQLIVSPEEQHRDKAYWMGQQFVKDFSQNYNKLQAMHQTFLEDHQQLGSHSTANTPSGQRSSLDSLHATPMMQASVGAVPFSGAGVFSKQGSSMFGKSAPREQHENESTAEYFEKARSEYTDTDSVQTDSPHRSAHSPNHVAATSATSDHHSGSTSSSTSSAAAAAATTASPTDAETPPSTASSSSSMSSYFRNSSLSLRHALSKAKLSRTTTPPDGESGRADTQQSRLWWWSGKPADPTALQDEAVNFMVGVMDECTHLGNFSIPVDPSLIIIVAAQQDAYIPRHGVMPLNKLWPGSEMRYLTNRGHVTAALLNTHVFRKAIADSFERQTKLYYKR